MIVKSVISRNPGREKDLNSWEARLLPIGLPLLLGIGLGSLLSVLIVSESNTLFALAIPLLIPSAILVIRYPLSAIAIWMIVMPWFPFRGAYKYVYFVIHRMLIPIALGLDILSCMLRLRERRRLQLAAADLAIVLFAAMGIVSILITRGHWRQPLVLTDQFLVPFIAYWLVRVSRARERELKVLIPLMLITTISECVIGLVSWFTPGVLPPIWNYRSLGYRTAGTFGQPAVYACIVILFSTVLYHDAMNRKKGLLRTLEILTFALSIACVFFTFTRGAWLAGILVLLVLLCVYPKPTARLIAIVMIIMILLSASLLAKEFAYAYARLQETEEGAKARLVLANAGKKMFYARPVFGWGFGNYDRYDWRFLERVNGFTPTEWQIKKGTSHHTYLTILAEMGIVGFAFYTLPVIWWLILSAKALPRLPKGGFWSRRLLIVMWIPMIAHIMLAQDLDMRFFYYALTLFWINLGFIANMVQPLPDSASSESRDTGVRFV
jgi:O-antigen ligase